MKIKVHYRSRVSSVGLKLNKVGVSSLALLIIGLVAGGLGIKYSSELSKEESVFALHHECNQYATTIDDAVCMQDMNDSIAGTMVAGRQYRLYDKRDDKLYYVAKLADGYVWMTQNLDLDLNKNVKLTPADSDVVADWTPAESTIVSECIDEDEDGTCEDLDLAFDEVGTKNTTPESYDVGDLYWNGIVGDCDTCTQYQTYITSDSSNTHYHLGNFYNWSAATANNDSSALVAGGEVEQSICPAGWSLPTALELPETNRRARDYMTLLSYYATEDAFDEFPLVGFSVEEDFNSAPYSSPLYFGYFREPGYYGGYWSSLYERSNDERTPYLATDLEISVEEEGYIGISSFIERKMILNVRCVAKSREAVPEPQPEPVEQVVSFAASSVSKSFGDAKFTNAASTTGDGAITYSSNNASVATVNSTSGEVTIVGVGSATITASAAATDNYLASSATYTLTVSKANRTVSFGASSVSKTYGDTKFTNVATRTGDGTIAYSSSNTSVASIDSASGEVTIIGAGSAIITASVAATSNYNAGSATYTLTVSKANRAISFGSSAITKIYGDDKFTNVATKTGDGTITYSSSNASVAEVAANGEVTIKAAGLATITASVAATSNYNAGSASYTLTVNKANRTVSFGGSEVVKVYGDDKFTNVATKTGDGVIVYSSSDGSVAMVDSSTGEITINRAGSATITASVAATSNYNAGSATYALTVNKKESVKPEEVSEVKEGYVTDKLSTIKLETKGLVWDDEDEQIKEGKNSYVVNYTENADSANYTTESFEIEVDGKHRKYEVVDGDKQTFVLGSEDYMSFTFDADYSLFEEGGEVYINEDQLDEEDYVSESGSTVIKVADEYLKTLDEGKYTLAVYFNDGGIATTSFTLEEPEVAVPDTGAHTKSNDKTTSVGAYILPFSAFALFSAFSVIARKKQKVCFDRK